jgi:hypothetical protein
MRAEFIYENISFERGEDPKKSMGIGLVGSIWEKLIGSPHFFNPKRWKPMEAISLRGYQGIVLKDLRERDSYYGIALNPSNPAFYDETNVHSSAEDALLFLRKMILVHAMHRSSGGFKFQG